MNIQLYCIYSHDKSLQQYANTALIESLSTTVFEAEITESRPVLKTLNSRTLIRPFGFVVGSCFQDIKALSGMGVKMICLDEDHMSDFSDYDVLNPLILVTGPVHKSLRGDFFLRIITEAISTYSKTKVKIDLNMEILITDDGNH